VLCYRLKLTSRFFESKAWALGATLALAVSSHAATPTVDPSFGTNGMVEQAFAGMGGVVRSVLARRDGSILAHGAYQYGYTPGPFGQPFPAFRGAIASYRPDGSLDTTFGQQGVVDPAPNELLPKLMLRDGKLVGVTAKGLIRYNADGTADAAFRTDGAASIAWYDKTAAYLVEQADGRIVAAGTVGAGIGVVVVLRFDADGSLDPTFNYVGAAIAPLGDSVGDTCAGLTITPEGKVVVAATANGPSHAQAIALMRFNRDGSLDSTFGANGRASNPLVPNARESGAFLVRQPSGRLVVLGGRTLDGSIVTNGLLLAGFEPDGRADASFGTAGTTYVNGVASLNDVKLDIGGRLLAVTLSNSAAIPHNVLRFTQDGVLDDTFADAGVMTSPILPEIFAISLQSNGDLLLGGSSAARNFAVARYTDGPVGVVEFYNAKLDHYFLTLDPYEARDLDIGVHIGWTRTGQSFRLYGSNEAAPGTGFNPVCRFYIPPQHGDSHFFSADPLECADVLTKAQTDPNYSGYVYETASAFHAALPDRTTGACPAGTVSVYRLWNHRADSNHRYTTDPAIRASMIAKGYAPEGYGPDGVAMCAPAP
jgi:uncharacterized delta-60 repeat protein